MKKRTQHIHIRVSPDEKEYIRAFANELDTSMTAAILASLGYTSEIARDVPSIFRRIQAKAYLEERKE